MNNPFTQKITKKIIEEYSIKKSKTLLKNSLIKEIIEITNEEIIESDEKMHAIIKDKFKAMKLDRKDAESSEEVKLIKEYLEDRNKENNEKLETIIEGYKRNNS